MEYSILYIITICSIHFYYQFQLAWCNEIMCNYGTGASIMSCMLFIYLPLHDLCILLSLLCSVFYLFWLLSNSPAVYDLSDHLIWGELGDWTFDLILTHFPWFFHTFLLLFCRCSLPLWHTWQFNYIQRTEPRWV